MNADVIDVKDVTFSRLNDYMGLWAMAPSVFENAVQFSGFTSGFLHILRFETEPLI